MGKGKIDANPNWQLFVDSYTTPGTERFGNGTKSALAAGMGGGSDANAARWASAALKRAEIQQAIADRMAAIGVTPATIRARVASRFFSETANNSDIARLGKLLAEMTPGALVPTKLDVKGEFSFPELIMAAKRKRAEEKKD